MVTSSLFFLTHPIENPSRGFSRKKNFREGREIRLFLFLYLSQKEAQNLICIYLYSGVQIGFYIFYYLIFIIYILLDTHVILSNITRIVLAKLENSTKRIYQEYAK